MITVHSLTDIINQLLPEPSSGLLAGILFGIKASIAKDLSNSLIKTGTIHIIALSGMNITLVTDVVAVMLLRIFSRRVTSLLTILFIIGFIFFVGPSPSVIRAGLMGCLALLSIVFGRQQWSLIAWIIAGGAMLLVNQQLITDLSFQLSMLASLGIILFGKKSAAQFGMPVAASPPGPLASFPKSDSNIGTKFISKAGSAKGVALLAKARLMAALFWPFLQDDLRVTLSAQLFTVPLIFFVFHRVSLVSPLTNILIGWTIAPITIIGWMAAILGYIFLPLGFIPAWVSWTLLQYLIFIVELTARLPAASWGW